jgi:hypothetical protein
MRDGSIMIYDFIFTLASRFIVMPNLIREETAKEIFGDWRRPRQRFRAR